MMKMLVMSLLTHSDCPCLPLTTGRESSQLNPKNTEHEFKPQISTVTNWYQNKNMTWNSCSLATVNLVKTNNCLNMMISFIAGISEYTRVTELQSYYGTLRTYAQGPSVYFFRIIVNKQIPTNILSSCQGIFAHSFVDPVTALCDDHRSRFAKNQANPAPSRRNPPARSIDEVGNWWSPRWRRGKHTSATRSKAMAG